MLFKRTIEDIILQQSHRGMDRLRPQLPRDFCREAAEKIYKLPRKKIILVTGFYVKGHCESDGPAGTACLALSLLKMGFEPLILTDDYCRGMFEKLELPVEYWPIQRRPEMRDLARLQAQALISIERCGRNDKGLYANMRGADISSCTAPLDEFFLLAAQQEIFTLGVGDGGNEIGMGNVADRVRKKLSLEPCTVHTDRLVLASVSNWGAYGLSACLGVLAGRDLLPAPGWIDLYMNQWMALGCVDGISGRMEPTVDGYDPGTEESVLEQIRDWELKEIQKKR